MNRALYSSMKSTNLFLGHGLIDLWDGTGACAFVDRGNSETRNRKITIVIFFIDPLLSPSIGLLVVDNRERGFLRLHPL